VTSVLGGLVAAVRTLSVIPLPGREAASMSAALPWFAVVGAALGAILFGVSALASVPTIGGWAEAGTLAVVIGGIVLTGGLHLDGLADWTDALGGATAGRRLEIMKDPRVGAFGVLAVVAILLCKWVALVRLSEFGAPWVVTAYVVSRTAMVDLAVALPYARKEGGRRSPSSKTPAPGTAPSAGFRRWPSSSPSAAPPALSHWYWDGRSRDFSARGAGGGSAG